MPLTLNTSIEHKDMAYPIVVESSQNKERYIVRYGLQTHEDLDYTEACRKLGQCLMHSLSCAGFIYTKGG